MMRDLDIPVAMEIVPTVRAGDGLALSSRNARLGPDDRERATALSRALRAVADAIAAGERDAERAAARGRAVLAEAAHRARIPHRRRPRHARAARARRGERPRPRGGPRRAGTADRQRPHRHAGGDPGLGASTRQRSSDVLPPASRSSGRHPAQAGHAHEARRDAGAGRADRDGHRVRPPERARRRGGGRRRRARRRQRGQQRARLHRHGPGHGRRAADARRRRPPRAAHAAAGRRPPVRLLRGVRRAGDRHRAPVRQGGRLRRGQGRGLRRPRAGDRRAPACR